MLPKPGSGEKERPKSPLSTTFDAHAPSAAATTAGAIGWRMQIFVFAIAFGALLSRRPDALSNPQFFGEDGSIWYASAYLFGWLPSLFHSQNGYFQTLPRLVASLALLAPFRYAPLLMNLIGLALQVLPVNILLSSRCRAWGPLSMRAFMGFVYIALPNTMELDAAIEEGQWHLALLACILVLACIPKTVLWRIFDTCVILLSGLSGPFSIVLLPIAIVFWWFRRERWRLVVIGLIAVTSAIQLSALLQSASATRPRVGLGATPELFLKLLGGQVYLAALLGQTSAPTQHSIAFLTIMALLGTTLVAYCLLRAQLEIKLFVCFAFLVFAASLRNPMVSMTVPQWQVLSESPGIRYWFFPMLGFAWSLIWCLTSSRNVLFQIAAWVGFFAMIVGIAHDWQYPPYTNFHFQDRARQFEAAPPGTFMSIPIFPDGWTMRLTKKGSFCPTLPFGHIDQPPAAERISGVVPVGGWVTASERIKQISLLLDGAVVKTLKPNTARPDVDESYPESPVKVKGWATAIDVSGLPPGSHQLAARALLADGCNAEFDIVTVEK